MKPLAAIIAPVGIWLAFLSTLWTGANSGHFSGAVAVFCVGCFYLFIKWPSSKGSTISNFQFEATRVIPGLVFLGLGVFAMHAGYSELLGQVTFFFSFPNAAAQAIRDILGSIGLSILLWWLGGAIIVLGFCLLGLAPRSVEPAEF